MITQAPTYLAVHEFEAGEGEGYEDGLPMKQLYEADQTEWSKRILSNAEEVDSGFWKLKRLYGEWLTQDAKL